MPLPQWPQGPPNLHLIAQQAAQAAAQQAVAQALLHQQASSQATVPHLTVPTTTPPSTGKIGSPLLILVLHADQFYRGIFGLSPSEFF